MTGTYPYRTYVAPAESNKRSASRPAENCRSIGTRLPRDGSAQQLATPSPHISNELAHLLFISRSEEIRKRLCIEAPPRSPYNSIDEDLLVGVKRFDRLLAQVI
jgi:hypothetical protein